ncbi:metallophosphoesterase [Timonella senegalensis]|uniref:metallophosphoesterase n=1 Tax=Timonella senegalensis TaxID=1465825 RepID=UPI0002ECC6D5|nr:metallophosphoesterase [Timonella senegalensis]
MAKSILLKTAAAGTVLAAAGLGYALFEAQAYVLRRVTVPVLPAGAQPIRILHISDLHMIPGQTKKVEWVRKLASLNPDFVVNTGDNFADAAALPVITKALEPLLDMPGAFVMGSNDYYGPRFKSPIRYLLPDSRVKHKSEPVHLPTEAFARHMTERGWLDLSNTRAQVTLAGTVISFAGLDDPHIDLDVYPAGPDAQVPEGALELKVGVVHAPYTRALDQFHQDDRALIIAGHTHGGQLCLPGYGAFVTNCDLDRKRAKGLHGWPGARPDQVGGEDSSWLYVSAGLGTAKYTPVRFACRPEATLMTLVPKG